MSSIDNVREAARRITALLETGDDRGDTDEN